MKTSFEEFFKEIPKGFPSGTKKIEVVFFLEKMVPLANKKKEDEMLSQEKKPGTFF